MKKINFNLPVMGILNNPQTEWNQMRKSARGNIRTAFRDLNVDWKKYNTKDYLFTHDSIVCSVETEENGYNIKKPCEELVNANGNAWKNEVLLHCFRTFIGGDNFSEHIQIPALSKGKILDAIIRPVVHHSKYGDAKGSEILIGRYENQLRLYARALSEILSKSCNGMYLYSFDLSKVIEIN